MDSLSEQQAFSLLQHNSAVLLTVNNRLSTYLHQQYARQQSKNVWETPIIIPWNGWLLQQFQKLANAGATESQLLSDTQERLLWEQVVEHWNDKKIPAEQLLRPVSAAESAMAAWKLINEWKIPLNKLKHTHVYETDLFSDWLQQFRYRCNENHWLTHSELEAQIYTHLQSQQLQFPANLILSGFDEFTSSQLMMMELAKKMGCQVVEMEMTTGNNQTQKVECNDVVHELRLAASRARHALEQHPDARIGIIIPKLQQLRRVVEREFSAVLHPETVALPSPDSTSIYNITLGTPLSDEAMVFDALLLLKLIGDKLSTDETGRLLLSTFVGGYSIEWNSRALLDIERRKKTSSTISLHRLLAASENGFGNTSASCPDLHQRLQQAADIINKTRSSRPGAWPPIIANVLEILGWPGERSLNSREYQVREHFIRLIEELGTIDPLIKKTSFSLIIRKLNQICSQSLFQKQGGNQVPVQISGPLEAAGQCFDSLWVLGADDESWPSHAQANPLLPLGLQKEYGLPHTTAERETSFYKALTNRLIKSAPSVIFSHARMEGERELRPSPLIRAFPVNAAKDVPDQYINAQFNSTELESVEDTVAQPLSKDSKLQGGSGLIAAQSNCPFQAFARYRLNAGQLDEPDLGYDAMEKGTITHTALESIWSEIANHQQLLALDEDTLSSIISQAADRAVENNHTDTGLASRFRQVEKQRLENLLHKWLIYEKSREPFSIKALEEQQDIELKGVTLSLRIDRIDELEDGRNIIIDYKTGRSRNPDWESARINEPQLPLYTLAIEGVTAATMLAYVNAKQTVFKGLSQDKDLLPGITAYKGDWQELQLQWQQSLGTIATEIKNGYAAVSPIDSNKSCAWCEFHSLCRIDEYLASEQGVSNE